jgi:cellulose synthase/poly-beta-1,6-N-acetylglucosamine synthase-like glycosyltransferase
VMSGHRIACDRDLLSLELAPTTLAALAPQRIRWAQGWFQVTRQHLGSTLRSPNTTARQKAGFAMLLGWRAITPWLSLQTLPLLAFALLHHQHPHLFVPVLVATTLITGLSGPLQTWLAHRYSAAEIRPHRRWFVSGAVLTVLFYSEYKNALARVAQLQELRGIRHWQVTPRTAPAAQNQAGSHRRVPRIM